ncbi:MAG: methionine--tRNA ligase [Peptostreptococcaceae bacterium]|nr:methionine--tRNA ligase [Peptostreptococcaceae bacterium]
MKKTFYVTTPIYYPSGRLHIGHTYCTVAADSLARYKRFTGHDVMFLTGTDEHGEKIEKAAKKAGLSPKEYLDGMIKDIKKLWKTMDISYDKFIRTTDEEHKAQVAKIFQQLYDQDDIYLGEYEGWYCVDCEAFWTEAQLENGNCPDCGRAVDKRKERSYFFRLSKYQKRLEEYYRDHPDFVYPESRKNEMLNNFFSKGLDDLSVTRTTFDWGVPVPFDDKHVIYVWIDALCNYITALNCCEGSEEFAKYWPADVQLVGKEIIRFHTIIWPALLMALDLPLPKKVFGHGWIMFSKDKMSKSKGNVVYPEPLIERYGTDALKYFLLREFVFGQDGNYTNQNFLSRINSDLVNDLGNLLSRSTSMVEKYFDGILPSPQVDGGYHDELKELASDLYLRVDQAMNDIRFSDAFEEINKVIRRCNKYIDETAPWILAKDDSKKDELATVLYNLIESLRISAVMMSFMLNDTAEKIFEQIGAPKDLRTFGSAQTFGLIKPGTVIKKGEMLFPRIDIEADTEFLEELFSQKTKDEPNNEPLIAHKGVITYDDFEKLELRVAEVIECYKHPDADKLLVFKLKLGVEERQIVSGIAKFYDPKDLVGKKVVIVANLKPIKIRGMVSEGMILSASTADDKLLEVLAINNIPSGSEVR